MSYFKMHKKKPQTEIILVGWTHDSSFKPSVHKKLLSNSSAEVATAAVTSMANNLYKLTICIQGRNVYSVSLVPSSSP